MTGDTRAAGLPRWALVATGAVALAYAIMQAILARAGEPGLAGFPPPAGPQEGIVARQLGNAALGLVAAALALLLRVALWLAALLTLLGAGVVVARATRLTATFGAPPTGATGLLVAALGGLWAVAWPTLAWHATRHPAAIARAIAPGTATVKGKDR